MNVFALLRLSTLAVFAIFTLTGLTADLRAQEAPPTIAAAGSDLQFALVDAVARKGCHAGDGGPLHGL